MKDLQSSNVSRETLLILSRLSKKDLGGAISDLVSERFCIRRLINKIFEAMDTDGNFYNIYDYDGGIYVDIIDTELSIFNGMLFTTYLDDSSHYDIDVAARIIDLNKELKMLRNGGLTVPEFLSDYKMIYRDGYGGGRLLLSNLYIIDYFKETHNSPSRFILKAIAK